MSTWQEYQEAAAIFFRSIGLIADTDVTLQGVRTKHDIDVVVRARHVGFDLLWVVECKYWARPVSKLHVLALREIVSDLGADRGIILSESGYQSGAEEAAGLTNVQLTSLEKLENSASYEVGKARLRDLQERAEQCERRYWEIGKEVRIDHGLRPPVGFPGYSARREIEAVKTVLSFAFRDVFPIRIEGMGLVGRINELCFEAEVDGVGSPLDLASILEPVILKVESLLDGVNLGNAD
ncbi:restriction endonuclease [Actinosynnema sp. NPDC050436]|uniref:restriction endonuclease n=1 Tax=Actinosynnema sp. NPDC050436 TaxID=3155659 RepID=UPI0033F16DA6